MLCMYGISHFLVTVIIYREMVDFSMSNVTDYAKFLMLLQKEMFTCISDDIKPIGCTFNLASSLPLKHWFCFI